jgi:proteasome lid subunit RPN8/RPN11
MRSVRIPQVIYDALVAHAREGFPNEICGVVLGPPGEMREVHRAQNTSADPLYTYNIDGKDLLRLNELADERGWEFVAIYHSHPPFAEVYPSATDIAKAFYPDAIYIILAIGQVPSRYREQLRDPQQRAALQQELGDPQMMPPRVRAYHIIKKDVFDKEGRVEELAIEMV